MSARPAWPIATRGLPDMVTLTESRVFQRRRDFCPACEPPRLCGGHRSRLGCLTPVEPAPRDYMCRCLALGELAMVEEKGNGPRR